MHSTHRDKVLMGISAKNMNSANCAAVGFQFFLFLILLFSEKMKTYTIYFVLDLFMLIPLVNCFLIFMRYNIEDRPLRRTCLPIACFMMIIITGAYFFQCVCMILKQKGKFDIADKTAVVKMEVEATTKSTSSTTSKSGRNSDKYAEKANYDIIDDDEGSISLPFYIFINLILIVYWCSSYLIMNAYVQRNSPMDLR